MTTAVDCEAAKVTIIPPLTVTDAMLTNINVLEDEHPAYDATASYADTDSIIANHRIYRNNSGSTLIGSYPPDHPTLWEDLGASNAWKMFDEYNNSQTVNAGSITFDITSGAIVNSLALMGLSGSSVNVQMIDPVAGVVYDYTKALVSSEGVVGLYSWLYREHSTSEILVLTDLPTYRNATVRVTIEAGAGSAGCSNVAMGAQKILGTLQYGFSLGILDFSSVVESEDGNVSVNTGNYADEPEIDFHVDNAKFDYVKRTLTALRGTPAVFVCGKNYETMTVFGFYRSFRITVPHASWAECTLTIRGLI